MRRKGAIKFISILVLHDRSFSEEYYCFDKRSDHMVQRPFAHCISPACMASITLSPSPVLRIKALRTTASRCYAARYTRHRYLLLAASIIECDFTSPTTAMCQAG